ncbi:MAG: glycoside hydrolase family 19 protein [Pseudomonadota bacterium]
MPNTKTVKTAINAVAGSSTVAKEAANAWASKAAELQSLGANSEARIASIIGQCAYESGGFTQRFENLNYSVNALQRVFGRYFKTVSPAAYARKPKKIANLVYANRMGNGDEASGDGYRYRGRGWIQLTGKSNYATYGEAIGVDLVGNPDLAADPATAWLIAVRYMAATRRGGKTLLEWADLNDEVMVTKGINGGTNGLQGRLQEVSKVLAALSGKMSIAAWQTLLAAAGFNPGPVDGLNGPKTKAAMKAAAAKFGETGDALAKALKKSA